MKYQVWNCQIVVRGDACLPYGFDFAPRRAAVEAIERSGVEVLSCFSGWGGTLNAGQQWCMELYEARKKKETK